MEHRLGNRTNTKLDVQFYDFGVPVGIGKTRNIGAGGLFVETNYRPYKGACCIEIALLVDDVTERELTPVKALIIHRTKEGFGLMIDQLDTIKSLPIPPHKVTRFRSAKKVGQL